VEFVFRNPIIQGRYSHGWSELPELVAKCGLSDVEHDVVSSDRVPETRKALTVASLPVLVAFSRMAAIKKAPGAMSLDEVEAAEKEAWKEIESGCYTRYDVHTAIGFKPHV
jgi:hypothetical protein